MCALSESHLDIAENVARVRQRIAVAAARAGRRPADITLVAVSKTVDADRIIAAAQAGITDFGENYVQEAAAKIARIGREVRWHFIGHLQTNKAKAAVELFEVVQAVDSERLAVELDRRARATGRRLQVLIEVNVGGEETKFGVAPADTASLARTVAGLEFIELQGLMTIGRPGGAPAETRAGFRRLRDVRDEIVAAWPEAPLTRLSMGMSQDFEVAIEEGSDIVRVGTAIFGPRAVRKTE